MPIKSIRLDDGLLGRIEATGEGFSSFIRAAIEQRLGVVASGKAAVSEPVDRWKADKAALLGVIRKGCHSVKGAAYELDWTRERVERIAERLEKDGSISFARGVLEEA
ncbi:hypothetical protein [Pseudooceanicola nitratireducens]|uniref:hypothetical protein n=1 Tax=Pseudooceanicola nitratireducens TaxID=517719 RepID=UPI003C7ADF40